MTRQLEILEYPTVPGNRLGVPSRGVFLYMDKTNRYCRNLETLDTDWLPLEVCVTPVDCHLSKEMYDLLFYIAFDHQGTPRKFKDTVRRIQDGQPIWFGKGRGPVFFQVQAALLADLRRMFDVSLPEREGPVNFKDLELWNKVAQYLTLRGAIPTPTELLNPLTPYLPEGLTLQSITDVFLQPEKAVLRSFPAPAGPLASQHLLPCRSFATPSAAQTPVILNACQHHCTLDNHTASVVGPGQTDAHQLTACPANTPSHKTGSFLPVPHVVLRNADGSSQLLYQPSAPASGEQAWALAGQLHTPPVSCMAADVRRPDEAGHSSCLVQMQQQQVAPQQHSMQQPCYQVHHTTAENSSSATQPSWPQQQATMHSQWQQQQQQQQTALAVPSSHPAVADPSRSEHQQQQQHLPIITMMQQQPVPVYQVSTVIPTITTQPLWPQQQATMHSQWQQQQAAVPSSQQTVADPSRCQQQQPVQVYVVSAATPSAATQPSWPQQQATMHSQWQQQQQTALAVPSSQPTVADPLRCQQQQHLPLVTMMQQQPVPVYQLSTGTSLAATQPWWPQQQATMHSQEQQQQQQKALAVPRSQPTATHASCPNTRQAKGSVCAHQVDLAVPSLQQTSGAEHVAHGCTTGAGGALVGVPMEKPCLPGQTASAGSPAGTPNAAPPLLPAIDLASMHACIKSMIRPGDEVVVTGASDPEPGSEVGMMSLQVMKMLGMGGNGAVFLTRVVQLVNSSLQSLLSAGSFVVVKFSSYLLWLYAQSNVPADQLAAMAAAADAFVREEYSVMRDCSKCDYTVHAYGHGNMQLANKCCSQLPVLMVEYCNLGSWGDLLFPSGQLNSSSIKQDAPTVQYIVKQVLAAIMFMADNDILHRDIKPDNIMFQGWSLGCCAIGAPPAAAFPSKQQAYPFVVKVGDFGCGRYKRAGMGVTRCLGTGTFQPPEMSCPEATFHNTLVDVWGLVMSFLVARTGVRNPFGYLGKQFSDLSPKEALQLAEKRLEELPSKYGHIMTKHELDFAMGGLQGNLIYRMTPYQMWASPYISLGPEEEHRDDQGSR